MFATGVTMGLADWIIDGTCLVVTKLWRTHGSFSRTKGSNVADGFIKKYSGWLLLGLFAFEGVTGMAPAIYIDLDDFGESCNTTQTMTIVSLVYS